jgi:L-aminoadipate-semialdehyde dehydrogenase
VNAVGVQTLGIYLAYLVAVGFLPAPAKKGECELPRLDRDRLQALATGRLGGRSTKS